LAGTILRDSTGRSVEISQGRPWLIVYLTGDAASAASRAVYLGILADRFSPEDLGLVGILGPGYGSLVEQLEERDLGYPLLADPEGMLSGKLGLEEPGGALWMVDAGGAIDFVAPGWMLQDADLRQLIEKQVLGEVTYFDPEQSAALEAGATFPVLKVDEVRSGNELELDPAMGDAETSFDRLVVFSADCVSCSLSGALSRLERQIDHLQAGGRKVAALFSSRFSPMEIATEASYRDIPVPLLVAQDEITGIEDRYYLQSLHSQVTIVDLDSQGRVEQVFTFNTFEQGQEPSNGSEPSSSDSNT